MNKANNDDENVTCTRVLQKCVFYYFCGPSHCLQLSISNWKRSICSVVSKKSYLASRVWLDFRRTSSAFASGPAEEKSANTSIVNWERVQFIVQNVEYYSMIWPTNKFMLLQTMWQFKRHWQSPIQNVHYVIVQCVDDVHVVGKYRYEKLLINFYQ